MAFRFAIYVVIALSLGGPSAHALSCLQMTEERSLAILDMAVLIFDGEILSTSSGIVEKTPKATARIVELYKGEASDEVVSFRVPGAIVRSAEMAGLPGLDIGEGDRGLIILKKSRGSLVQTNVGCDRPWPEHLEQLRGMPTD